MTDNATRNLATAQAVYQAFGSGNIPAIIDVLADDVQWESWGENSAQEAGVPWMASGNGKAGAMHFFQTVGSDFDITEFSVLNFAAGGDRVFVEFVMDANIRSTGKHFRDEEIHLWTFNEDGKVSRLRHYVDTAKHIAAAAK